MKDLPYYVTYSKDSKNSTMGVCCSSYGDLL